MKKIYSFLIIVFATLNSFSQNTHVQIKVNNNTYVPNQYASNTSDSGLNTILTNNNVNSCYQGSRHPVDNTSVIFAVCPTVNLSNFISELNNYTSLVTKTSICPQPDTFGDVISTQLLSESIGTPTGFDSNGIVVTNDNGLNTIFQNFSVKYFGRQYPSATAGSLLAKVYYTMCNCDVVSLKNALDSYNSVINNNYYVSVAFLSIDEFTTSKTKIYPNPFPKSISIESENAILSYSIYDVSGKEIINTLYKEQIERESTNLKQGIYILKLLFENGEIGNYRLVKK